jgi:hypothetical protein
MPRLRQNDGEKEYRQFLLEQETLRKKEKNAGNHHISDFQIERMAAHSIATQANKKKMAAENPTTNTPHRGIVDRILASEFQPTNDIFSMETYSAPRFRKEKSILADKEDKSTVRMEKSMMVDKDNNIDSLNGFMYEHIVVQRKQSIGKIPFKCVPSPSHSQRLHPSSGVMSVPCARGPMCLCVLCCFKWH